MIINNQIISIVWVLSVLMFKNIICDEFSSHDCSNIQNGVSVYKNRFENRILSRRKRYLVFPEGSNFILNLSTVKALLFSYPRLWNALGELDVLFKLPNDLNALKRKHLHRRKFIVNRRNKRDIYGEMEGLLDRQGFDGRACILRTICEVKHFLAPKGMSLIQDIIRVLFSMPSIDVTVISKEEADAERDHYDAASTAEKHECDTKYAEDCRFSLIEFLLTYNPNRVI